MELLEDRDARRNAPGELVAREVEARQGPQGREVEGLQRPCQPHPSQVDAGDHRAVPPHAAPDAAPTANRRRVSPGPQGALPGWLSRPGALRLVVRLLGTAAGRRWARRAP